MKKLTKENQTVFFRQEFEEGEIFTYSKNFSVEEVRILAEKSAIIIRSFKQNSREYREYDSYAARVTGYNLELVFSKLKSLRIYDFRETQGKTIAKVINKVCGVILNFTDGTFIVIVGNKEYDEEVDISTVISIVDPRDYLNLKLITDQEYKEYKELEQNFSSRRTKEYELLELTRLEKKYKEGRL